MKMVLPKISPNYYQERSGVLRVASLLNSMGFLWRETPNADVGIDGQVEFVDKNGMATGATVAVQTKSGESYFQSTGDSWKYYPTEQHETYWENYPLPVILLIHQPETDVVYWVDARRQLRSEQRNKYLSIPKNQILSKESGVNIFGSYGETEIRLESLKNVLRHLAMTSSQNPLFPISYLDIFLNGLTDIGRKLFFSMGMCLELAELHLSDNEQCGISIGYNDYDFVDGYVKYLVSQSLAVIDYNDFLIDLNDRHLVSTFLVPLTSRGNAIRDLCREIGSVGSAFEITEASVGFILDSNFTLRWQANADVSRKIIEYCKG